MLNPTMIEMLAQDRITDLRRGAANRSCVARSNVALVTVGSQTLPGPSRQAHLANPRRAIGWFLVSVGLRLALARTPPGSAR